MMNDSKFYIYQTGSSLVCARFPLLILFFLIHLVFLSSALAGNKNYRIHTAPRGEPLSEDYKVSIEGEGVPVYLAKVASLDEQKRWKAMDDKENSADYFDMAAFAYFDIKDQVTVQVSFKEPIQSVRILPASARIKHTIKGNSVSFILSSPKNLTVEINGEWVRSLHLFANAFEEDVPDPEDPNVIYFGPGIHEVGQLEVGDNQTVYVAAGAIVRGIIEPGDSYYISDYSGLKRYAAAFHLKGNNITFRGRGIVDGGLLTTHSREMIFIEGANINLEGIILRDAPHWTVPVRQSERVHIDNIKLLGYRANSDGIDIVNSSDVLVENCFIRTLDDLVVIKSDKNKGATRNIITRKCVLWNEVAHALSIGAEVSEDVDNILFSDCDIIHDKGREWTLRVFHADAARVSNVRFEHIRIEESSRLISLWIDDSFWSRDKERGHIRDVVFSDIEVKGSPSVAVQLLGFDEAHLVEDVLFKKVTINKKTLTKDQIESNPFVKNVTVK